MNAKSHLIRNSLVTQFLFFFNLGIRFLITPLIIKSYSSEIVGLYYLIINVTSYVTFFDFGIGRAQLYLSMSDKKNNYSYFITAQLFYAMLAMGLSALVLILLFLFEIDFQGLTREEFYILIFSTLFSTLLSLILQSVTSVYELEGKQYIVNSIKGISLGVIAVIQVLLILNGYSIASLALIHCGVFLIIIVYFQILLFKSHSFIFPQILDKLKQLIQRGKNIMFTNLSATIYTLLDISLIPLGFGLNAVTAYSISANTSRHTHGFTSSILSPVHPYLSYLKNSDHNYLSSRSVKELTRISLVIPKIIGVNFFLWSEALIELWISKDFSLETFFLFKILILSWTIHACSSIGFRINEVEGNERKNLSATNFLVLCSIAGIISGLLLKSLILFAIGRLIGSIIFTYSINRKAFEDKQLVKLELLLYIIPTVILIAFGVYKYNFSNEILIYFQLIFTILSSLYLYKNLVRFKMVFRNA